MVSASLAANRHLGFSLSAKNILQISHKEDAGPGWNQNQLPKTTVFILMRADDSALKKVSQSTIRRPHSAHHKISLV